MAVVLGQGIALNILAGLYNRLKKPHHAYLFHGKDGVGKFESALNLAKVQFCEVKNGKYCNVCDSCRKISEFRHPDVITVLTDNRTLNARFFYERYMSHPSTFFYYSFRSATRAVISRAENRLLPVSVSYPASLPKDYMLGKEKTDKNRGVMVDEIVISLNGTLSRLTLENMGMLESIFTEEKVKARDYISSQSGRKGGKSADLSKDTFFDALEKVYYNVSHLTIPIDTIRAVISRTQTKPSTSSGRIIIIEGLDLMENTCANIFLRTLEEPPENNTFFLLSSRLDDVRDDVIRPLRSRTMGIDFPALNSETIERILIERFFLPEDKARIIAPLSGGSLRRAIKTATQGRQEDGDEVFKINRLFTSWKNGDLLSVSEILYKIADDESSCEEYLSYLCRILRISALIKTGVYPSTKTGETEEIARIFLDISLEKIIMLAEESDRYIKESRRNIKRRLLLMRVFSGLFALLETDRSKTGRR